METQTPERKAITFELKADDAEGSFTARIATLGVIDKDDDIIQPGAFPAAKDVVVSSFQHTSWQGALPIGMASLAENGQEAIATGRLFLDTTGGSDAHKFLKQAGNLVEWSFGFKVDEWTMAEVLGKRVRHIMKLEPYEVSPVLVGAGINTGTLAIKGADTYADEGERAIAIAKGWVERSKSLADLRQGEGRKLSAQNIERLDRMLAEAKQISEEIEVILKGSQDDGADAIAQLAGLGAAQAAYFDYQRIIAGV
jgi:HK97 family phage prohead protease